MTMFVLGKGKEDNLTGSAAPPQNYALKLKMWKADTDTVMS